MSRFPLIAGLLALPILAGVGGSMSIAQNANDDAAKAALSAGFSKLKAARPDTAASNPVGISAGFEAVTREREFQAQLSAEQARYQAASPGICQAEMKSIEQCIAAQTPTCKIPAPLQGYSVSLCRSIPARPSEPLGAILTRVPATDMSGKPIKEEDDDDDDGGETFGQMRARIHREQADWDARYSAAHAICRANMPLLEAFESCVAPARAACNPRGVTQASCLQERQAAQPTRERFKAKLDQIAARSASKTPAAREDYPGQDVALANYLKVLNDHGVDISKSKGQLAGGQAEADAQGRKDSGKLHTYEVTKSFGAQSDSRTEAKARQAPALARAFWEQNQRTDLGATLTVLSETPMKCSIPTWSTVADPRFICESIVKYRITSPQPSETGPGKAKSQ